MKVVGLDHVVLRVGDAERSLAWYRDVLGLAPERTDEWRRGEVPFPSVRVDGDTIVDLLPVAGDEKEVEGPPAGPGRARRGGHTRNVDHLCFVVGPADLEEALSSGRFDVITGPAARFGARGIGTSVYVRDPDDNVVELRHYG